jgi:hypothetical protein
MEDGMRRCNGRLFDGSACNNLTYDCDCCGASGCPGDGCDSQIALSAAGCDCGGRLTAAAERALIAAAV